MSLPQEHVQAINELRVRLSDIIISLDTVQKGLAANDPLPSWPELQADADAIGSRMQNLAEVLNSQRQLCSTLHAYPNATFPAYDPERQQFLYDMLYKKLPIFAEDWIENSLQDSTKQNGTGSGEVLPSDQMEGLWDWARHASNEIVRDVEDALESDFTLAEREAGVENVVTGLKRNLAKEDDFDDDDDDDEEDEDDMDEDQTIGGPKTPMPNGFDASKPALSLEGLLRFASGGEMNPPAPNR